MNWVVTGIICANFLFLWLAYAKLMEKMEILWTRNADFMRNFSSDMHSLENRFANRIGEIDKELMEARRRADAGLGHERMSRVSEKKKSPANQPIDVNIEK